jgi:hypothetical protein
MRRSSDILLGVIAVTLLCMPRVLLSEEIKPLVGINLYGGAERDASYFFKDGLATAHGLGGAQLFGVAPLGGNFGFQGSLGWEGGTDIFRTLVSGGPIYNYSSGKFGLFVDYEYKLTPLAHVGNGLGFLRDHDGTRNNFVFLRGVWTHYFDSFDFLLSYTQPVSSVQNTSALQDIPGRTPHCVPKKDLVINELKAILRFYPTRDAELHGGILVNSFAGPTYHDSGTGVGGAFGASYRLFGPVVLNLVQGQFDSRSRYRVTSGVQFFWSPSEIQKPIRETVSLADFNANAGGTAATSAG